MKIKSKKHAEAVKEECIKISAEALQAEFELEFSDCLEEAQAKLMEVTNALDESTLDTCLLQDNRLYLYEILLGNTTEEIVAELDRLIRIEKKG